MMACPADPPPHRPAAHLADAEAACRDALSASLAALEVCDRNLLRFHYFHGLTIGQLAEMFSTPRPAVLRQLARIRERMLRDTRRGLTARLSLGKAELDQLAELIRQRFDLAVARILRTAR